MLVRMVCKTIDRRNMLLYALSMILSVMLALTIAEVRNEVVFGSERPDCLREFIVLPETVITEYEGNRYMIIARKGNRQKEYEQYKRCFA